MSTATYMPIPEPVTAEELPCLTSRRRRASDKSSEEFLRRWDAGEYAGPDGDRADVVKVAMLIPLAR